MDQLRRTDVPPLFYALAVRLDKGWGRFLVISRARLQELWNDGLGSENTKSGDLELYVQFRPEQEEAEDEPALKALCGTFDLTAYLDAWESLPPLEPPLAIDPEVPQA
jgi:hypothetical protein